MSSRADDLAAALGVDSGLLRKHLSSMLPPATYELRLIYDGGAGQQAELFD